MRASDERKLLLVLVLVSLALSLFFLPIYFCQLFFSKNSKPIPWINGACAIVLYRLTQCRSWSLGCPVPVLPQCLSAVTLQRLDLLLPLSQPQCEHG